MLFDFDAAALPVVRCKSRWGCVRSTFLQTCQIVGVLNYPVHVGYDGGSRPTRSLLL